MNTLNKTSPSQRTILAMLLTLMLSHLPLLAQTQIIRGAVQNANTKQAVTGARILVAELGKGANSQADGAFRLPALPAGRYTLRITALGYEAVSMPVVLTSGKELILTISLAEKIISTGELTVMGRKDSFTAINEASLVSSNAFSVDNAYRFAGARSDVARMASAFAGVVGANDQRNDIIIRGGSPTELLWRLDGLDIPNPNHFATQGATGGPVNALNINLLDNSDFLTGAFSAEYGDRLSGVFDLRTRRGNDEKFEFTGQFAFNGIEAMVEGPVPLQALFSPSTNATIKSSFMASYRKSFLDVFIGAGGNVGVSGIPRYEDLSLKFDLSIGERHKIWLTGLGGVSSITIDPARGDEVFTGDQRVANSNQLGTLGVHWQHLPTDRSVGTLTLGVVANRFGNQIDSITATSDFKPNGFTPWFSGNSLEGYATAKYRYSVSPDAQHTFVFGAEARSRFFDLREERFFPTRTGFLYKLQNQGNALHTLSFAQWLFHPNDNLSLNVGIHSQYLGVSNRATIEPRFSLNWSIGAGHSLSFGTGIYRQSQPLLVYFTNDNAGLDFTQAIHYVAGYSWQASTDALFKAEGYFKDYSLVPVERERKSSYSMLNAGANFGSVRSGGLVNTGAGRTYGAEVSFLKHFAGSWYAQSAVSWVRQEFRASDSLWRYGAFDNGLVVSVLGGYEWKVTESFTMEFSLRYTRAGSGARTPIDLASSRARGETVFNTNEAFSLRYPDYERADGRIDFRLNFQGWSLINFFSVENIFNRRNLLNQSFSPNTGAITDNYQLGRFFIGGFRIEF